MFEMQDLLGDSRTESTERESINYLSSDSGVMSWGQPPASHYFFVIRGNHIIGRRMGAYVSFVQWQEDADYLVSKEFSLWEAASDEDLSRFEEDLEP